MSDNLNIWNAVNKTDPAHTKAVTFGRKFTSIDAHWQIMRATEQFGPVGMGWGYTVDHSVERLTPEMILAVADVTIWWRSADDKVAQYGPVRATCEMYGPKTDKGKPIPGLFVTDEDAPKKAMTDALTKGLSHLGFSADVFLGLFDDNRYVQKVKKEFEQNSVPAGSAGGGTHFRPERRGGSNWVDEARRDGTLDESRPKGQLPAGKGAAAPINTPEAAGNAVKRIEWVKKSVAFLKDAGTDEHMARDWWTENKLRVDVIETALPTEYERLLDAYNEALERKVDA